MATPATGPASNGPAGASRLGLSRRMCLRLTAIWAGLGAAACAVIFAISTIPGPGPNGRAVPAWLELIALALAALMLPRFLLTPYSNLARPGWHALDFSLAFAIAGAGMALVLHLGTRSATHAASAAGHD